MTWFPSPPSPLGPGGPRTHCLNSSFPCWNCFPSDSALLLCLLTNGGSSLPGGPARPYGCPVCPHHQVESVFYESYGIGKSTGQGRRLASSGARCPQLQEGMQETGRGGRMREPRAAQIQREPQALSPPPDPSPSHWAWHPLCQRPPRPVLRHRVSSSCLEGGNGATWSLTLRLLND